MTRFLLFLGALSVSTASFAQVNFVPGKVTLANGESIDGLVNDKYWLFTPRSIEFKGTDGVVKTFYPKDLLEFRIGTVGFYKSRVVEYDSSSAKSNELRESKEPTYKSAHLFLRVLVESDVSLLMYVTDKSNFFFAETTTVQPLVNHHYIGYVDGERKAMVNKIYVAYLRQLLRGCVIVPEELQYKSGALTTLFVKLAACNKKQTKVYGKKNPPLVKVGGVVGLTNDVMLKDFKGGRGFAAGGSINTFFPYRIYRFSLYCEFVYRMMGDQRWEGKDAAGLKYHETYQIRSLKPTFIFRSRLNKKPGGPYPGYTYAGLGLTASVGLKDLYQRDQYVGKKADPFGGLVLNAGVYVIKNVAIDFRYEAGNSINMGDYVVQDIRQQRSKGYTSLQASLIVEF